MKYRQPPHLTDDVIETLLEKTSIARFCSMNPDGTIHAVPVSYKYKNGNTLITTPIDSRKARNVMSNRTVTVLVDVAGQELSDFKAVIVYSQANLKAASVKDMMLVGEIWMPADKMKSWSEVLLDLTDWAMITIEPQNTASFDYGKDVEFAAAVQE